MPVKIKLEQMIIQVAIEKLKPNPLNRKFFRPTDGANTDWLYNDIAARGILDPLQVKKDNVLLTGHRRLAIAKQLKLNTVPVRYVINKLTEAEEKSYLIKDNVLRRHLTPGERKSLYRFLVPDFDEKLLNLNSRMMGINQGELAEISGLPLKTVGYDLSKMRHEAKKKMNAEAEVDILDEKAVGIFKKACANMLNNAIAGNKLTLEEFRKIYRQVGERLESIDH